jgi:hypothetical protein
LCKLFTAENLFTYNNLILLLKRNFFGSFDFINIHYVVCCQLYTLPWRHSAFDFCCYGNNSLRRAKFTFSFKLLIKIELFLAKRFLKYFRVQVWAIMNNSSKCMIIIYGCNNQRKRLNIVIFNHDIVVLQACKRLRDIFFSSTLSIR